MNFNTETFLGSNESWKVWDIIIRENNKRRRIQRII